MCGELSDAEGMDALAPGNANQTGPKSASVLDSRDQKRGTALTHRSDYQENQVLTYPGSSFPNFLGQQWWASFQIVRGLFPGIALRSHNIGTKRFPRKATRESRAILARQPLNLWFSFVACGLILDSRLQPM